MMDIRSIFRWIGEHSNKVRAAIWSTVLLLVALGAFALTEFQLAAAGLALSNILDLFVETNTVSKVRVGERITEEVTKQTGTPPDIPPTTGTGSSSGVIPALILGALLFGAAGCAQGMHNAARAEDVLHDGLMAFDRSLDTRCDSGELTPGTCREINKLLVPVWDITNELNRTVRSETPEALQPRISALHKALQELIKLVNDLVTGGAREFLLRELNLALKQAGG